MKKILIIGKGGQVSENLINLLKNQYDYEFKAVGFPEIDLSKPDDIYPALANLKYKPDIIINAAAYTAVDQAEDERETCNNVNHLSVVEIARFAAKTQALLVHYSTDYVFDGAGTTSFDEANQLNLNPVNYYGLTKLQSEHSVIKSGCNYIIFRISWVYNDTGKNFVKTILKLAAEKDELRIIDDQIGSPTYAYDVANATIKVISGANVKTGIYNLVPKEQISWHQFAVMIVETAKKLGFPIKAQQITPIKTSEYPTKAKRALNSRLSVEKIRTALGIELPAISTSLNDCLSKIKRAN